MRPLACLLVLAGAASADLTWELEGYPRILKAAEKAKADKTRILVGMSGSPG
ncbi:MAG: hypothetical protein ACYTGN_11960 [Planctomycetota bacterium]|jgi:hypothetical protein